MRKGDGTGGRIGTFHKMGFSVPSAKDITIQVNFGIQVAKTTGSTV